MTSTSENIIAFGILQITATQPNGVATSHRLRKEIPNYIALSSSDQLPSATRNGEPMWHQIVRNVKSHYAAEGNYICEGYLTHVPRVGYAITALGTKYLKSKNA
jgi:hypothetical protein